MSKRLVDLDPRFVKAADGRRVGVSFWCPACDGHRVSVMVDPPFDAGPPAEHPWKRTGEIFADLTLTPSIVAYRYERSGLGPYRTVECWHGFITSGQATP